MKWGQVILDNTLYKWRSRYISYKALKRIIRSLSDEKSSSHNQEKIIMLNAKFSTIVNTVCVLCILYVSICYESISPLSLYVIPRTSPKWSRFSISKW